jgi:hypothetical protein
MAFDISSLSSIPETKTLIAQKKLYESGRKLAEIARHDATVLFFLRSWELGESDMTHTEMLVSLIDTLVAQKTTYMAKVDDLLAQLPPTGRHHE